MKNLPLKWRKYLSLQKRLAQSRTADGESWGLEAAMNRAVDAPAAMTAEETQRTIQTAARRERHRNALRRTYGPPDLTLDIESQAEAREQLGIAAAAVSEREWTLLSEVAGGETYSTVAAESGATEGALRIKVSRLRVRMRTALAA